MYKTILLAYDGSQDGLEALRQGADLARLCRARVHLFAVAGQALDIALSAADLPEREYDDIRRSLEEGARSLRESGLEVDVRLGVGNPPEKIGSMAREVQADLIVVGHRTQSALLRWWNGSTGAFLLTHAPCSLLVAIAKHA
jgi:nucleotide-binding universal stress UspA family protein